MKKQKSINHSILSHTNSSRNHLSINVSHSKNSFAPSKDNTINESFLSNVSNKSNLESFRSPLFSKFDKLKERRPNYKAIGKKIQKITMTPMNQSLDQTNIINERRSVEYRKEEEHNSVQKQVFGYIPKYEKEKRNLNINRQMLEEYKYFQDKNQMTKMNFNKNIIVNKADVNSSFSDNNVFEKDNLQIHNKRQDESSRVDFYKNQKFINQINDEQSLFNEKPDQSSTQVNNLSNKKLSPSPSGLIRNNRPQMYLGSSRMEALIDTYSMMPEYDQPDVIDFSDNNFDSQLVCSLIETFKQNLTKLVLKGNKLGLQAALTFSEKISNLNNNINLKHIDLCNANLGDNGGSIFLTKFSIIRKLEQVNLSDNNLGAASANALFEYFEGGNNVTSLFIHNNGFNGWNLRKFLTNIHNYNTLVTLDLSWNNIGSNTEILNKFFDGLAKNKNLVHLDLSHNSIKFENIKDVSLKLNENHSLIGMHMAGNDALVDGAGYIHPTRMNVSTNNSYSNSGINQYMHQNGNNRVNCWICEKWTPVELGIKDVQSPVFLHLEFLDQTPWCLLPVGDEEWKVSVMFPPGEWRQFFTSSLNTISLDINSKIITLVQPLNLKFVQDPKEANDTTVAYEVNEVNIHLSDNKHNVEIDQQGQLPCYPRCFGMYKQEKVLEGWSEQVSIWKNWVPDETELHVKCFDNDWGLQNDRLAKLLKDDEGEKLKVRNQLRTRQKTLRQFQRQWASFGLILNVWCIEEAMFQQIFEEIDMFDENFTRDMIPIIFREKINVDKDLQGYLSPLQGCVRHQFINFMLKVIIRKQNCGNKTKISISKAVQSFFEKYGAVFDSYSHTIWREKVQQVEEVDKQLKKTKEQLNEAFARACVVLVPGERPCMTIIEAFDFLRNIGIIDYITIEKVQMCFNFSISDQIDEVRNDLHIKMRQNLEFQEFWARILDNITFPMIMSENIQARLNITTEYPAIAQEELKLVDKLWVLMPHLMSLFDPRADVQILDNMKKLIRKQKQNVIKLLKQQLKSTKLTFINNKIAEKLALNLKLASIKLPEIK